MGQSTPSPYINRVTCAELKTAYLRMLNGQGAPPSLYDQSDRALATRQLDQMIDTLDARTDHSWMWRMLPTTRPILRAHGLSLEPRAPDDPHTVAVELVDAPCVPRASLAALWRSAKGDQPRAP
jgi:hypothetical protein